MEAREAIKRINEHIGIHFAKEYPRAIKITEALYMAVEALKKQIPEEPYLSGDGYWNGEIIYDTWECPNCGETYELDYDDCKYCPKCGQAIDWKGV